MMWCLVLGRCDHDDVFDDVSAAVSVIVPCLPVVGA